MYIGIDIGSVTVKLVIVKGDAVVLTGYSYHRGDPLDSVSQHFALARSKGLHRYSSLCITGSGRKLLNLHYAADIVKNEITALWKSSVTCFPGVKTIMEIGGQDSKLVTVKEGEISNFKLNSVCAAGTGSFIDQQAHRLGISIDELSIAAAKALIPARFTGRCTVFVETEMVNLQQRGFPVDAIAAGLFDAVCENYINDLGAGMVFNDPVIFCGGVSRIAGVKTAFEKKLGKNIIVPELNNLMGAYGAALLAREHHEKSNPREKTHKTLPESIKASADSKFPARCNRSDCLNCGLCEGRVIDQH